MNNNSYLFLLVKGYPFNDIVEKYHNMRIVLEITGRKKNNFSANELSNRISLIDEYQSQLLVIKRMSIGTKENYDLEGYRYKSWAIKNYHNFVERRKKYGI
jgi:hypothetical protein